MERLRDGRVAARIGSEYRVWSAGLEPMVTLQSPLAWMTGATLLDDGRFLTWQQGTAGGNSGTVHTAMLWSPDGTPGPVLEGHAQRIRGGFQVTEGHIVTWDHGGGLRFWSADGRPETVVESVHRHVRDVFPLSDGRVFTWGQEAYHDNVWWARIWNARGESVPLIEASGPPLKGIELDDGRLLLGINSPAPTIWSTDGARGPVLRGHEEPAHDAEQWPDGRIVTYGADRTARVWSRDGAPLLVLRGHEGSVSGVKPLPGGRVLTWSFRDRTARIWSEEPRPRGTLRLPGGNAQEVKQLSGGLIAIQANDGGIGLHDAGLERKLTLRNDARDIAGLVELSDGRLLTQGSWASNRDPGPALRMWSAAGEAIGDWRDPTPSLRMWRKRRRGAFSRSIRPVGCGRGGPTDSWNERGERPRPRGSLPRFSAGGWTLCDLGRQKPASALERRGRTRHRACRRLAQGTAIHNPSERRAVVDARPARRSPDLGEKRRPGAFDPTGKKEIQSSPRCR